MDSKSKNIIKKLAKKGPFRASHSGLERHILSKLVHDKTLMRLSHGIYLHPESPVDPRSIDFAEACVRFGKLSAIGGLTALFHYNLIEQVPQQVWVIIQSQANDRKNDSKYRTVRTSTSFDVGIEKKEFYQITNLDRTLVEGLKLSSKIGLSTTIGACRSALSQGLTNEKKVVRMARQLGMDSTLMKHWEAILA